MCESPPSFTSPLLLLQVNSVEDGVQVKRSSRASQQIATVAEPTTGSSVTRKGVKYTPKLDSVVISSYKPSDAVDAPDSYKGERSKVNEVSSSVERSRPSRSSRPKSDSSTLGTLSLCNVFVRSPC